MKIKTIVDEDFINYKDPAMFICASSCSGKCWKELGMNSSLCQNDRIRGQKTIEISEDTVCQRYLDNPITKAIVFGGLEPFDEKEDILSFVSTLRKKYHCNDSVIIYTGYEEDEVADIILALSRFENIIVKFGRYDPVHYPYGKRDPVLGVKLSTNNQYAKKIGC